MTPADRYVVSGLDYTTWSNKMVNEGKMQWPSNPSTTEVADRTKPWHIRNVACGFVGASHPTYKEGEAKFCHLIQQYIGGVLQSGSYILKDGVCNEREGCTMVIDISFAVGGAFLANGVPSICEFLFEAIWNECNGTGGSAELTIGSETGTIQAQFFQNDAGVTCPANTRTDVCRVSRF